MKASPTSKEPTPAQLSACHRMVDESKNVVFYLVDSAHTNDQYEVRFVPEHGLTCTCRAGQYGVLCWHKRAAVAHDAAFKRSEVAAKAAMPPLPNQTGRALSAPLNGNRGFSLMR